MLTNLEFNSLESERLTRREKEAYQQIKIEDEKYWPNFFTETFAMKKRLLIKVETTFPKKY